jgi:DNA modification methylase
MNPTPTILQGDWLDRLRELPDASVHCVITSPPYWGLRNYGVAGQLGLEKTIQQYIEKVVEGFREVRRLLRADGTLWLNMGDVYASQSGRFDRAEWNNKQSTNRGSFEENRKAPPGLKPKDLIGLPWRVAFALQADGWWLRSDIIIARSNPMPESVRDRPTKAHEYLFMLTKQPNYYYDSEAVKEPAGDRQSRCINSKVPIGDKHIKSNSAFLQPVSTRNKRDVWTIPSEPMHLELCEACGRIYRGREFAGLELRVVGMTDDGRPIKKRVCQCGATEWLSHYATFPEALVKPCILAGTSARGVCAKCGAPWERVVEKAKAPSADYNGKYASTDNRSVNLQRNQIALRALGGEHDNPWPERRTVGWAPGCDCIATDPVPATVLDPFGGSGTTAKVAMELGRNAVLIELNPRYVELAARRCAVTPGLVLA